MATMILVLQAIGLVKEIDALQETRMAMMPRERGSNLVSRREGELAQEVRRLHAERDRLRIALSKVERWFKENDLHGTIPDVVVDALRRDPPPKSPPIKTSKQRMWL